MQFADLKILTDPVAPRASFEKATSSSDAFIAVYLQRRMEMNWLWKWLHIDFLLALAGFIVMLGEISGSINFKVTPRVTVSRP